MREHKETNRVNNTAILPTAGLSALKPPVLGGELRNRALHQGRDSTPDEHGRESDRFVDKRKSHRDRSAVWPHGLFRTPVLDSEISTRIHADRYASKYVPLNWRAVNGDENEARRIAWRLKTGDEQAIQTAAPDMAALIDGPCWLVPVPASDGGLIANFRLARAIADLVPGARVKCALARAHPVESSCERRLDGHFGLTIAQHAIIRTAGPMEALPVYFVDNVITTGTTIAACHRALGWGIGLAYADGSTWRNTRSRP